MQFAHDMYVTVKSSVLRGICIWQNTILHAVLSSCSVARSGWWVEWESYVSGDQDIGHFGEGVLCL